MQATSFLVKSCFYISVIHYLFKVSFRNSNLEITQITAFSFKLLYCSFNLAHGRLLHDHYLFIYLDGCLTLKYFQLMWAMEYNPNIFSLYQDSASPAADPSMGMKGNDKTLKQYGKFERKYAKTGAKDPQSALSIFLIASVLEQKHKRLMKEAKGLDDVVKVISLSLSLSLSLVHLSYYWNLSPDTG